VVLFSLRKLQFSRPAKKLGQFSAQREALPFGTECGNLLFYPEKTSVFRPFGLVPAQTKKIGTIFCTKGGLGQVPKGPLAQSEVINPIIEITLIRKNFVKSKTSTRYSLRKLKKISNGQCILLQ
jgi:hypothetical protein